ncbi:MAG: DUF1801 domain-containing protein [Armatimonadetes bacterium]|nr:DUF1801 domain-containing protein [Armatimonadota bacterium]
MSSIAAFLETTPEERREAIQQLRDTIFANLGAGFEERVSEKGIYYVVPHSILPEGYHCDPKQPLALCAIDNTKGHIALHFLALYMNQPMTAWFKEEYAKTGKKLDMGAGCIRFKKPGDIPFEVIGRLVAKFDCAQYVAEYRAALAARSAAKSKR